jgi:hypothetical protein
VNVTRRPALTLQVRESGLTNEPTGKKLKLPNQEIIQTAFSLILKSILSRRLISICWRKFLSFSFSFWLAAAVGTVTYVRAPFGARSRMSPQKLFKTLIVVHELDSLICSFNQPEIIFHRSVDLFRLENSILHQHVARLARHFCKKYILTEYNQFSSENLQ